jgi:hypothetical protein
MNECIERKIREEKQRNGADNDLSSFGDWHWLRIYVAMLLNIVTPVY